MPNYPQQKIKIPVPKKYSPSERMIIAEALVEHIRERTERGYDKTGVKKFEPLDPDYKERKLAMGGKGFCDLTLTGDMLISMDVLNWKKNGEVEIGFEKNSDENAKADGHVSGKATGKVRDFLGIAPTRVQQIIRELRAIGDIR